jgi:hypothetical protein
LHIGINRYGILENEEFKQINDSHNEAREYYQFFKHDLKYHNVSTITDAENNTNIKLRDKITQKLNEIHSNRNENKENPFKVNVISFSGHGITFEGDAIAVIP